MRSKVLCVSNILSTAYVIYLMFYFFGSTSSASGTEAIGYAIAGALLMQHIIMFLIGTVFGWLGFFIKKSWAALTSAILYAVGTLFFPAYFMFGVPILTIGFIGFSKQRKLNSQVKAETAGN